jgi:uncharacterized protein
LYLHLGLFPMRSVLLTSFFAYLSLYTTYTSAIGYTPALSELIKPQPIPNILTVPFYKHAHPYQKISPYQQNEQQDAKIKRGAAQVIALPSAAKPSSATLKPSIIGGATVETSISVAIIIDDLGYNYEQGLRAMQLPGAITYAIIPHSPKAQFFAQEAQKHNKEIMLHAPMSTINHKPLGKNGLTGLMEEADFKQVLNQSLLSLPSVKGMNNHMGSLLTQKSQPMSWVMQSLKQRQLYFIDSRTSAQSVAWDIAQQYGIPSLKRDVFLDHEPNEVFIDKQFKLLISTAKHQGYAVAIAHPHPETVEYLSLNLSRLNDAGISLVPASELAKRFSPNQLSPKITKSVRDVTQTATR